MTTARAPLPSPRPAAPPPETAARPRPYVGRFAPSPTGPLHAGSLVAALASWLDARVHGGQWLVRIEDIDPPRCQPGADQWLLKQLQDCALLPDAPPVWQSQRHALYAAALQDLVARDWAYGCACTRKDIEQALAAQGYQRTRHQVAVYPGTCRRGLSGRSARAWRLRTDLAPSPHAWQDRRLGPQQQCVATEVGDFVLQRADGLWAYQLAVVVDDGAQGVTHIVRGADLCDNTARQWWLQEALGLPHPHYLHTPLVLDASGEKLSKQHGAPAVPTDSPAQASAALCAAARVLSLPVDGAPRAPADWLRHWLPAWQAQWGPSRRPGA
ncbi:tRNA glutamyl-Q(34) synthetase GluQRS [Curvibacter sp. HBC61]|uniref:Glutamyl-Q tRNA(Asp) synthetase n=1 Tax=Curvibacter cyanobacteriorum TaxID=3026422 RepID=A0ABT5MTL0_9BURK|nr:tRNA glutamyl-Q(34) synthetase GluQRS [Curvibacter sp. HBC61]MDD0837375.1 tRNA glutamyl-Q(34) synthetase GluQRS [Curvibacter sp. HBC61]